MNREYEALIRSDRVSSRTRAALLERGAPDRADYTPRALSPDLFRTLVAVLARVLPQDRVDLAQRVDMALAAGDGDGWRFAALPPDAQACREGLATLDRTAREQYGAGFAALATAAQDALLAALATGAFGGATDRWFEDLRGAAVKIYVAHPSTLARIGYSGIAYGGDGPRKPGFHALAAGEREAWEPIGSAEPVP